MVQPLTPLSKLPNFDPERVPVIGVDHHLPAVPAARLSAQALRQRFAQPPAWQPEVVRERKFAQREPALASVLVGIVMRDAPTLRNLPIPLLKGMQLVSLAWYARALVRVGIGNSFVSSGR